MRFIENGPDIPSHLLASADAREVVFFCGAGVSLAKAGLLDFAGLFNAVSTRLGLPPDNAAARIVAYEIAVRTSTTLPAFPPELTGLASVDRLFGLLQAEFPDNLINSAVAKALAPSEPSDVSAHALLARLSRSPDGQPRIVTTNFDRLFEDALPTAKVSIGPKLPDPLDPADFVGIVKLHGSVNETYTDSTRYGFVLSSASFGEAYLSLGWATRFIRDVLDRYVVVFIGYSADDPPVRYLLEALARSSAGRRRVYVFQAASEAENQRWNAKGVVPISYSRDNRHSALWDTLEKWAGRVDDPDAYRARVAKAANIGPQRMRPHERGEVADLVSTFEGARAFANAKPSPPAEWICVFDRHRRYAPPGLLTGEYDGPTIDPFDVYGLDGDPQSTAEIEPHTLPRREVPETAWDAFTLTDEDRRPDEQQLRAPVTEVPIPWSRRLPHRVSELVRWLAKVAREPALIWWATKQFPLHPEFQNYLDITLDPVGPDGPCDAWPAWYKLFEVWEHTRDSLDGAYEYDFEKTCQRLGWSYETLREYEKLSRPRLILATPLRSRVVPPLPSEGVSLRNLVRTKIEFRDRLWAIDVPDQALENVIAILCRHLTHLTSLQEEVGFVMRLEQIPSIVPSSHADGESHDRTSGFGLAFLSLIQKLDRLTETDSLAVRRIAESWPEDNFPVSVRLQIWRASKAALTTAADAFRLLVKEASHGA